LLILVVLKDSQKSLKSSLSLFFPYVAVLNLNFFAFGAEGLSFHHSRSILMESIFAWVGYSISKDRHEEALVMIS